MHFAKVLFLAGAVSAHTAFTNFYIDGAGQGDATCVRMSNKPEEATFPIKGIESQEMACGVNGEKSVARVCPAPAGSVLTFEFRTWPDASNPGALDISHKGPCAVYAKKVDDASASNNAAGQGWFKIWEDAYDENSKKWCTERLVVDSKGLLSVKMPEDLAGGHYLVRPELLALHAADKGDPQFYVGCAQVFISGSSGSSAPSNTVSIPGYVSMSKDTKAMNFNIWNPQMDLPYPRVGPAPYTSDASVQTRRRFRRTSQTTQQTGLKPEDCILEVGNWCGKEVSTYSDESSCWASSEECWKQDTACYDSVAPTGGKLCKIWEDKCNAIQETCKSSNFNGPPNAGKDLTPAHKTIEAPQAVNGGVVGGQGENANANEGANSDANAGSGAQPEQSQVSSAPAAAVTASASFQTSVLPKSSAVATPVSTPVAQPMQEEQQPEPSQGAETPAQDDCDSE